MAKVTKKIDKVNEIRVGFVIFRCSAISGRAGAIMELASGGTNV